MIRATYRAGVQRGQAVCDCCGRAQIVTCGFVRGAITGGRMPDAARVREVAAGRGWATIRNRLLCPGCLASRRAAVHPAPVAGPAPEQPRAELTECQRREILDTLAIYYDRRARRYIGSMTDKAIAADLGGGCLAGWVAELRERYFGPAGGREGVAA
uniref:hypothetical protein n=1 Tax=Paenirhodobacter enshiensis TaxID=1105367 RepID=UPI0035B47F0D